MSAPNELFFQEPLPPVWEDNYGHCVREGRRIVERAVSDLEAMKEAGTESDTHEVRRAMDEVVMRLVSSTIR